MPITPEQSSQLKALCSPDPGHLELATPAQNSAWQLSPSLFQCSNPGRISEDLDEIFSACTNSVVAYKAQRDVEHD